MAGNNNKCVKTGTFTPFCAADAEENPSQARILAELCDITLVLRWFGKEVSGNYEGWEIIFRGFLFFIILVSLLRDHLEENVGNDQSWGDKMNGLGWWVGDWEGNVAGKCPCGRRTDPQQTLTNPQCLNSSKKPSQNISSPEKTP